MLLPSLHIYSFERPGLDSKSLLPLGHLCDYVGLSSNSGLKYQVSPRSPVLSFTWRILENGRSATEYAWKSCNDHSPRHPALYLLHPFCEVLKEEASKKGPHAVLHMLACPSGVFCCPFSDMAAVSTA